MLVIQVISFTGAKPWANIMGILEEKEGGDNELLVYAMTLLNKVTWTAVSLLIDQHHVVAHTLLYKFSYYIDGHCRC